MFNEEKSDFAVRSVFKEDSKRIWEIRNHPATRETSGNQNEIAFEDHDRWFMDKYFKDRGNLCFVLENKKNVIGYCRFDVGENGGFIISIALDHNFHKKGLGHLLLSESLKKFGENRDILAVIKKGNEASVKLFLKNNFQLDKEDGLCHYFIRKK